MKRYLYILLCFLILLPYAGMGGLYFWYKQSLDNIDNAAFIIISKEDMNLRLIDFKGREIEKYPIACGQRFGNKEKKGDFKTPEGLFHISEIVKSDGWSHDFGDGKGNIPGAYGPYFIRLNTPGHKGIGIHGTHKPESIGTRDTEGCIRLHNEDIKKLQEKCHVGMLVYITTSYLDVINGDTSLIKSNPANDSFIEENNETPITETTESNITVEADIEKTSPLDEDLNNIINEEIYEVQSGDSFYKIASGYRGTSAENIMEYNNMTSTELKPGMKIKIPIYKQQ